MRIVILARHQMLVKALGAGLADDGHHVETNVGMFRSPAMIRRHQPHVVVADEWNATTDRQLADLDFALVLISDHSSAPVAATSRTLVRVQRSAGLPDIVALIRTVTGTGSRRRVEHRRPHPRVRERDGVRRLASFLSARERDVLSELVQGADTVTLARTLRISRSTARDHVQSIMTKMDVHSRIELVSMVVRERLIDPATGLWLFDAG